MNIQNNIVTEAIIGINLGLNNQELVALKDKCEMINAELATANKGRIDSEKDRRRTILMKTGDVQDLMTFMNKLTQDVVSTTECNAELFETQDKIAEYNEQALL